MHKEVLRSIEHIGMYPVFSFVLFFIVFILILVWVIAYDKKTISTLSALPIEDGTKSQDSSIQNQQS